MKHHLALFGLAAVLLIVGVAAFGLPVSSLLLLALVVCPLMMIFMMRGMHGGGGHDGHDAGARGLDEDRGLVADRPMDSDRPRSDRK
ncbi:DUF2933 domain-containing protein [Pseudonocardia hydrocarbonoxydans]|uniref:DUF2933 domain-containing protein n=1 Tax=Pseudonocardia hydrocarbonoxydans TaxID=76726 RepID=UPI0031E0001B